MAATHALAFKKMNGLGNAFVVLDARGKDAARAVERGGLMAKGRPDLAHDQLIVIETSGVADAFARFFNADGSEAGACGNGSRCVAWLLAAEKGRRSVTIETRAGVLGAEVESPERITIDMGEPRFGWADIPLAAPFDDTRAITFDFAPGLELGLAPPSAVNVGNPHVIFWVDDPSDYDLARLGPMIETHPLFPERANVSLARVSARDAVSIRTWERGAGLTKACGTAACAAAVAAARKGLTDRRVTVTVPGGDLEIEWTPAKRILMTGPAELEFEGEFALEPAP